jgi:serine/threonine protein kinase
VALEAKAQKNHIGVHNLEFQEMLEEGGFSHVFLARHRRSGELYAVKKLKMQEDLNADMNVIDQRSIYTELTILTLGRENPFIIQLESFWESESDIMFVMEYASEGDLLTVYEKRGDVGGPFMARIYAAQIVLGLEFLHKNNIAYR